MVDAASAMMPVSKKSAATQSLFHHVQATFLSDMPIKTKPAPRDFRQLRQGLLASEIPYLDTKSQQLEFANEVCMALFDGWCERRNVVALAYLMHSWPLTGKDLSLIRRLLQSLRELEEHHLDSLLDADVVLLSLLWENFGAYE